MCMKNWRINQSVAGCIITLGGFGFGCGLAWTATALPNLEETGQVGSLTTVQKSWIASSFAAGALLICPVTGLYINNVGRKQSLLGFSVLGLMGWLLLGCATHPIYIYFGRLLTGMSTGGYTIVVPIYISEIASTENRGRFGSMFVVMLCLGKLFSNGVGTLFTASTSSFLCAVHPFLYAVGLLFIPESPKYLERKGKFEDACNSSKWFETTGIKFGCSCQPQEICTKFQNAKGINVTSNEKSTGNVSFFEFFTSRELRIPTLIVFTQMLLAQFCGINVSTFFTVEIFKLSGDALIDSKHSTLILAAIQTIGCLPCSIFVDKYGRKVLIVSSLITMSVAMLGMAIFFFVKLNTCIPEHYPLIQLSPIACLVLYNLAYSWGIGSVVWIIVSDILPAGPASAIANILYWGGAFCVTKLFQIFINDVPMYSWFILFSSVCAFGSCFNVFFLPETKGLSTQEIQNLFKPPPQKNMIKV